MAPGQPDRRQSRINPVLCVTLVGQFYPHCLCRLPDEDLVPHPSLKRGGHRLASWADLTFAGSSFGVVGFHGGRLSPRYLPGASTFRACGQICVEALPTVLTWDLDCYRATTMRTCCRQCRDLTATIDALCESHSKPSVNVWEESQQATRGVRELPYPLHAARSREMPGHYSDAGFQTRHKWDCGRSGRSTPPLSRRHRLALGACPTPPLARILRG